ncbi:PREDICTED: general transcription factor IIF subunit 1-like isoform X2 [Priapulus caudatus]|uniref:Transcription initiation factor IIF subunit alpha n=1 Tax=Priapulus caudatus TaxID=37621 RepID=A0ABM1FAC2_PRICU|nr:PREDICTED: general transcription factor IIF subunit 1-like isoform X2 [Priapulus caudatus]
MAAAQGPSTSTSSTTSSVPPGTTVQEFVVKVPKETSKKYDVMKFNGSYNVDMAKWNQVQMVRENNLKEFRVAEDMPKYGAGSEFGREQREEARRKKYGIVTKKYDPEAQPWLLREGGKNGKRYKGIREGGVTENSKYFVFTQAQDGAFEAYSIDAWYNFTPVARYKTLNDEEAEEEFGRRNKVLNHFSIMVRKRLKAEGEEVEEVDAEPKTKEQKSSSSSKSGGSFRLTDHDEWQDSDEDEEDSDAEGGEEESKAKGNKKGKPKLTKSQKKKKDRDVEEEAVEESDEGDYDDAEIDYISESSSSEEEAVKTVKDYSEQLKGVDDEMAEIEMEEEEEAQKNEDENEKKEENEKENGTPDKKKKEVQREESSSSGSDTSDSDIDDTNITSSLFLQKKKSSKNSSRKSSPSNSISGSRPTTPQVDPSKTLNDAASKLQETKGKKRAVTAVDQTDSPAKKPRTESPALATPSTSEGITEEAVKRYLMRKPMTTKDLLQKFKKGCRNMTSEQMVTRVAQILKRLNPEKTVVKDKGQDKMLLFIRKTE